jgi:hypothetical protein
MVGAGAPTEGAVGRKLLAWQAKMEATKRLTATDKRTFRFIPYLSPFRAMKNLK